MVARGDYNIENLYGLRTTLPDPSKYPVGSRYHVTDPLPDGLITYIRIDDEGTPRWRGTNAGSNGFLDRSRSTISFDEETRTLTITAVDEPFVVRSARRDFEFETIEAIIPDIEGEFFVYVDADGEVQVIDTFDERIITTWAFVSEVWWDADNGIAVIVADERHGTELEGEDHLARHRTIGAQLNRSNGLETFALTATLDGDGSADSHAQIALASGSIYDEDLKLESSDTLQTLDPIAEIPILYRLGELWKVKPADEFPLIQSGALDHDGVTPIFTGAAGRIAYNPLTESSGALTEVTQGDFTCVHVLATNDIQNQVFGILGHEIYTTANEARAGTPVELKTFATIGLPTLEWVWLYTLVFQTSTAYGNAVAARLVSDTTEVIDWRNTQRLF